MDSLKDNKGQDNFPSFVLLKLQKLSSALYLITNVINDSDPIKWKLRDTSLSLISKTDTKPQLLGQLINPLQKILSLIDIARSAPGVSAMNLDLLRQEYLGLLNKLEGLESQNNLDSEALPRPSGLPETTPARLTGVVRRAHHSSSGSLGRSRGEQILRLIKQNGPLSIKEVAKSVPGVSSKTVQRELADLVRGGFLRKEGERRWSRYLTA